ncbi:MAG: GNAT family N-acetyltransferase [Caulobacteraceae bacterium]|nr:GNAT family N-acetyltransferase [Caulobacteraceae bacterium]
MAGPGDAEALAAVHALAFDAPWSADEIAALLAGPGVAAWLVEAETAVGMSLVRTVAGEGEVLTIAVAPVARRRGVGDALVAAAVVAAGAAGADSLFHEVADDNAAARALYAKAGFVPVGRRAGYYRRAGRPVDALVLRRSLNSAQA